MSKMTVEQLLCKTSDKDLLDMFQEIHEQVIPETGYIQMFRRNVNKLIDKGEMCINPTTYRKVYLPTLVRLIEKELATRYYTVVMSGLINAKD